MNHHVLCDTDILIDYSRGVVQAATILGSFERTTIITISLITQMELLIGCKNKRELQNVEKFISRFHVQRINHEISDRTIILLREYRLSMD